MAVLKAKDVAKMKPEEVRNSSLQKKKLPKNRAKKLLRLVPQQLAPLAVLVFVHLVLALPADGVGAEGDERRRRGPPVLSLLLLLLLPRRRSRRPSCRGKKRSRQ